MRCRYAIDTQQGFENVLVIDNTPIVDAAKKDLLLKRLRETFAKAGAAIDEDKVDMPWDDEAGTNKGCVIFCQQTADLGHRSFLFLTYPTAQEAENAMRVLDGTQFGRSHTLYVNRFGDIERYANLPVGEGELPTGWKEKSHIEKVSKTTIDDLSTRLTKAGPPPQLARGSRRKGSVPHFPRSRSQYLVEWQEWKRRTDQRCRWQSHQE